MSTRRYARRRSSAAALDVRRAAIASSSAPDYSIVQHRGAEIGHIEFALHGQVLRARLLHTGHHARRCLVEIDGALHGTLTNPWDAWRELSRRMPRMLGLRNV